MDLLGGIFKGLFSNAKGILDETITTEEERLEAEQKLKSLFNEGQMAAGKAVTERWKYDMESDNKLSKNIRPLTLIFLTFVFVVISFADGNIGGFNLNPIYAPIYTNLLMLVFGAYFAGRTFEKVKNK
tara:strand:+ start:121 stop:504 length:384 start_codon:yes stop_codon:yes gene_type:complete